MLLSGSQDLPWKNTAWTAILQPRVTMPVSAHLSQHQQDALVWFPLGRTSDTEQKPPQRPPKLKAEKTMFPGDGECLNTMIHTSEHSEKSFNEKNQHTCRMNNVPIWKS